MSNSLIVSGGRLFTPEGFIDDGAVVIIDGKISFVGATADLGNGGSFPLQDIKRLDATGCIVSPGFLDVHVHGGGGADAMNATVDALRTIAQTHGRHGTTGFLATTMSAPQQDLMAAASAIKEAMASSEQPAWNGAQVLGVHLEGPYFSYGKRGAQNPAYLKAPSRQELQDLMGVLGPGFKLITLAPELEGATPIIAWLSEQDVTVSLGHSEVPYDQALQAIKAGASHATHTFNGMNPIHHREPGLVGAVLGQDEVTAELIADGIHIHPGVMRVIWQANGANRTCLVTDAMAAMGMAPGRYELGGLSVDVKDNACRLVDGGNLAGSVLSMDRAVKNCVEMAGIPLADALNMATAVPAREMRLSGSKGKLEVGKDGDLTILGSDLVCQATVVAGRVLEP